MFALLRPAFVSFAALTLVTGVVYPAVVTGIAKVAFAEKAGGSVITRDGKAIGSSLIGQNFTDAKYFWPRPSAAGANGYDAASGSGSNLGPSHPALAEAVAGRIKTLRSADHDASAAVPVDLVTASGSGLDPHISPEAAEYQISRVARARGMSDADVRTVVARHTEGRTLGVLGEPRINVLLLNIALDTHEVAAKSAGSLVHNSPDLRAEGFLPTGK